jgi:diacylglycerol kinase (ATP)
MQSLVIVNPAAGGGRAGRLERPIREHLAAIGLNVAVEVPTDAAALRSRLGACAPGTRVAVVGGDGTLQHALPALVEARLELAVVPCGSGNDLARALGVAGWPWRRALEWGLRGRAHGVDLGQVDAGTSSHWFASSLTAGFDSAVGRRAAAAPAWLPGRLRYLSATLAEVASLRHWSVEVEADGVSVIRGPVLFASVVNTPTYGSGLPVVPQARIDDRRLDLVVAGDFGRRGVLAMLPRLMAGRHLGDPRVQTRPVTTVTVRGLEGPLPLAADGEWLGETPAFTVHLRAAALGVVRGTPEGR